MLFAGEERPGGAGTFPVYDPARTGAIIGYAAAASATDAEDAVAAAAAAWPAWAAMSATDGTAVVLKALSTLDADADADERTDILSCENGKIRFEAMIDTMVFADRFHQAAEFAPSLDVDEHLEGPPFNTTISKLSAGVVTIIYPFNWPLAILAVARQLRTGVTFFNNHNATAVDERAPFGFNQSGIGRERVCRLRRSWQRRSR